MRQAPLQTDPDKTAGLSGYRDILVNNWITPQIEHHKVNAQKQIILHHDIEKLGNRLFVAVFLCASLHLADVIFHISYARALSWLPSLSLLVCIGGPALIAGRLDGVVRMPGSRGVQTAVVFSTSG